MSSIKKGKTITISPELEEDIVYFIDDELQWHIHNCVPEEYETEIKAQIQLLRLLGYDEMADNYENDYNDAIDENDEDDYDE